MRRAFGAGPRRQPTRRLSLRICFNTTFLSGFGNGKLQGNKPTGLVRATARTRQVRRKQGTPPVPVCLLRVTFPAPQSPSTDSESCSWVLYVKYKTGSTLRPMRMNALICRQVRLRGLCDDDKRRRMTLEKKRELKPQSNVRSSKEWCLQNQSGQTRVGDSGEHASSSRWQPRRFAGLAYEQQ
jgi:hypothetical protein